VAVEHLVEQGLTGKAPDNITAVAITIAPGAGVPGHRPNSGGQRGTD
jgi:hypothetical protein